MDNSDESGSCQDAKRSYKPLISELVEHDYVKCIEPCVKDESKPLNTDNLPEEQVGSDTSVGLQFDVTNANCNEDSKEDVQSLSSPNGKSISEHLNSSVEKHASIESRLLYANASYFNLASEEGQEHLRELNEELKALNEQGSPKLSLLHGPAESLETAERFSYNRARKHSRKRKRFLESIDKIGAGINSSHLTDRYCYKKTKRKLPRKLCDNKVKPSQDGIGEVKHGVIAESAEDEIERILQEKAWKNNLTTVNVKNILRYVVTNEHVLAMVRNTMQAESGEPMELSATEAVYEPKLTRSKAKELLEKQAKVPWPISPIKKPSPTKSRRLIELEFSETDTSSDEEYTPHRDVEASEEESFQSSQTSEVEMAKDSSVSCTTKDKESVPESMPLDALESEDTIALRTRSKLPLNDTPLESIEAEFVAPDITTDMYDSECDDEEWRDFLGGFLKPLDLSHSDNIDDETNDPEYNFLEEEDVPDREDLRDDRAVKITKKELHELMAELFEAAEAELAEVEEEEDGCIVSAPLNSKDNSSSLRMCITQATAVAFSGAELLFDLNMRQQLEEQMRKHVQLLTQAYLLSANVEGLMVEKEMSKSFLLELQTLTDKSEALYGRRSSFQAHNLKESIRIVTSFNEKPTIPSKTTQEHKKRPSTSARKICDLAIAIIANSKVFMYPDILPVCGFRPPIGHKLTFVEAEDNLLAMGLEEFLPLKEFSCWKLIKDHMIPVKTAKQIFIRAKNLRSTKCPFNPVKHYYKHKCAPIAQRSIQPFSLDSIAAPTKQPLTLLPEWLQAYITEHGLLPSDQTGSTPNENVHRPPRLLLPAPSVVTVTPVAGISTKANVVGDAEMSISAADAKCTASSVAVTLSNASSRTSSCEETRRSNDLDLKTPVVPKTADSQIADVQRCSTMPSNVNLSDGSLVILPVLRTPEKSAGACSLNMPVFSPGFGIPRLSPLKRVSPIIKKYRPRQLRKTGGNLSQQHHELPNLLPKVVVLPQATHTGPRVLAPKTQKSANEKESKTVTANVPEMDSSTDVMLEEVDVQERPIGAEVEAVCGKGVTSDEEPKDMTKREEDVHGEPDVTREQEVVQKEPSKEFVVVDCQDSESEIEAEMFDDGDDTADDDVVDMPGDNEDDLAALMAASTTIKSTPRHRHQIIKKNKKLKRDRKALLAMLSCDSQESDPMKEEREATFAQAYLQKVREAVGSDDQLFEEFLRILHEFSQNDKNVVQLYKDVSTLLKDFPELCEEFVAFLLPEQAFECGKFMEYLTITKMQIFIRKLEVHFGKHPHHIQKIIKVLAQIQLQENLTIEDVKTALLPLLRGQQHLIEELLQLFPQEAPPQSCMTDFEEIFVPDGNDELLPDCDGVEVIELPEKQDSYGGDDCICSCHLSSEKLKVQNRYRHCVSCGIKFIDGRIFLQTGKLLKPCQVAYLHPHETEPARKEIASNSPVNITSASVTSSVCSNLPALQIQEPTSPTSSISSLSPSVSKESDEEPEPEIGSSSNNKVASAKDMSTESPHLVVLKPNNPLLEALEQISQDDDNAAVNFPLPSGAVTEDAILTPDTTTHPSTPIPADFSTLRQVIALDDPPTSLQFEICQKRSEGEDIAVAVSDRTQNSSDSHPFVNLVGDDCATAAVLSANFRLAVDEIAPGSPDLLSGRTQSRQPASGKQCTMPVDEPAGPVVGQHACSFGEEQTETPTVSGCSDKLQGAAQVHAENHAVDGSGQVVVLWTRELDRILLQTCQQLGPSPDTFAAIAAKLESKTVEQVAARFQALIALFSQQDSELFLNKGSSD